MSTLNVVAISKTTELLLTSCVPHIVRDGSSVRVERQRVHLYSQSGYGGRENDNYIKKHTDLQAHVKPFD